MCVLQPPPFSLHTFEATQVKLAAPLYIFIVLLSLIYLLNYLFLFDCLYVYHFIICLFVLIYLS